MAIASTLAAQSLSPLDYGLREATTGIERYQALYNTHVEALKQGLPVSYDSIDTLELEMPAEWKSIPLGRYTDFGDLVLYVTNHAHHGALFTLTQGAKALEMDKMQVDGLDYRNIPELAEGWKLLVLNDKKPWTERRGFGYMQYRSDLIVVHDGLGQNSPVMPWGSDSTILKASYYNIDTTQKVFRNITMHIVYMDPNDIGTICEVIERRDGMIFISAIQAGALYEGDTVRLF